MENKIIAVDFDGTLCENKWPEIGEANKEMITYLKDRQENGDKLILWTCRVDDMLKNAVDWSAEHGLIFDSVNENLPEIVASFGTDTRKIFANEYIDDRNCTKFKLPFTLNGITDDLLNYLETLFGFKLYDWQKSYLKGNDNSFLKSGRRNGKTFTYCLRLLLEKREPFVIDDFRDTRRHKSKMAIDECHGPHYEHYFCDYIYDLNRQLIEAGLQTNLQTERRI